MRVFEWIREQFELERKSDGLYRCKGGSIADILFLSTAILYVAFVEPFKRIFKK